MSPQLKTKLNTALNNDDFQTLLNIIRDPSFTAKDLEDLIDGIVSEDEMTR